MNIEVQDSERLRILIVEDEALIAMECEFILSDAEYDVVGIAADEAQALHLRLARGGNGIEVAAAILERWGIRSIFVSAHGDQATRERAAAANPVGWVVKPYTSNTLLDAIATGLSQTMRAPEARCRRPV